MTPTECPCRKALEGLRRMGMQSTIITDALAAPCPLEAENERLRALLHDKNTHEPDADAWEALIVYAYKDGKDGVRVIQQITEHYLHMRAERDAAIRTRNLAQEASTANLEAKRTAEAIAEGRLQQTEHIKGNYIHGYI